MQIYTQVYTRLNHFSTCVSYSATLRLVDAVSKLHSVPLQKWITEGATFKFIGDNVDKKRGVRDVRSDHSGKMMHMYSVLVAKSRLPPTGLEQSGRVADVRAIPWKSFLPSQADVQQVKRNLVVLVSRLLTQYVKDLAPLSKSVPQHIEHQYSQQMSKKSEVAVVDVLMKNEVRHSDMVDIMQTMQGYLGDQYPPAHRVASGGDQLTIERQIGSQRHLMDGDTPQDRLQLLEPQCEDWHCLVIMLSVS